MRGFSCPSRSAVTFSGTPAFSSCVVTVLRMEWNTCAGPKPSLFLSRPNRLPTAPERSPYLFAVSFAST